MNCARLKGMDCPTERAHKSLGWLPMYLDGASCAEGDVGGVIGHAASGPVVTAATMLAAKVVPKIVKAVAPDPARLYESALKPSTTLPLAKRAAIVETGLKNEIPVSAAGAEKISGLIDDLNSKDQRHH